MKLYDNIIWKLDEQTQVLKDILNLQRRRAQNLPQIIMYEESKSLSYYTTKDSYFAGLINYSDRFLIIIPVGEKDYSNYSVLGSWDNWANTYPLFLNSACGWGIFYNDISILLGINHYKLRHENKWLEPSENELRKKDKNGNWNNVLFVHE